MFLSELKVLLSKFLVTTVLPSNVLLPRLFYLLLGASMMLLVESMLVLQFPSSPKKKRQ